jgi:hypothetical protein
MIIGESIDNIVRCVFFVYILRLLVAHTIHGGICTPAIICYDHGSGGRECSAHLFPTVPILIWVGLTVNGAGSASKNALEDGHVC